MVLPFFWQIPKNPNPLVDNIILFIKFKLEKMHHIYYIEYLRNSSTECQKVNRQGIHTVQPKLQMSALGPS